MPDHVGDTGDVIGIGTQGDKKSHLLSMFMGVAIGAFASSAVLLAFAMAYSSGQ